MNQGRDANASRPLRTAPMLCGLLLLAPGGVATRSAGQEVIRLQVGAPTGKRVSPLHFAVNAPFSQSGFALGVKERRPEFRRALRDSGVRAIRFPGGGDAYFYLPEGRPQTVALAHAIGDWSIRDDYEPCSHYVSLEELTAFCRWASQQLIYQLPCLFYLDGQTPRAIIPNDLCKVTPTLFDQKRIAEGVAYGMGVVRRLRRLGAPVAAWELGNEEFGFCQPEDYAEVAAAYVREIRKLDRKTPILVEGMGANVEPLARSSSGTGLLDSHVSFRVHYPFGNWPGPPSKDRNGDAAALVLGDVRFDRWLDVFLEGCRKIGLERPTVSVSETMVFKFDGDYWDPYAVIGTQAHALLYAWNWMTLLERPEVNLAAFHDLDSPYFGILRYDVGFDRTTRHFAWLGGEPPGPNTTAAFPRRYMTSPTGLANQLLSELAGEELLAVSVAPSEQLRLLASARRVVAVNRSPEPVRLAAPFARASGAALTADALDSCLPGQFRLGPLPTKAVEGRTLAMVPAWSVAVVRREQ